MLFRSKMSAEWVLRSVGAMEKKNHHYVIYRAPTLPSQPHGPNRESETSQSVFEHSLRLAHTRSGCRRLAGKRLHLPKVPFTGMGTRGGSQQSSRLWHHQLTAQHAEGSSWLACKRPGLTGNHGETSAESLKGQTGVLKAKSNIQA